MSLQLTNADRFSIVMQKLVEHWKEQLEYLRGQLEGAKGIEETNILRGRILEIRTMLNAQTPPPEIPPDPFTQA